MKRISTPSSVVGAMALTVGCATKKEVSQQTHPGD